MSLLERLGLIALHRLDPELAHGLSLKALNARLLALPGPVTSPRLATKVAGIRMTNPVGLAAGYDKNAVAIAPLAEAGFGFLEVGAATPLPQPGNPKPRLFRLKEDRAVINRFGFNNDGMEAITNRLAARETKVPVGVNLGANKTSADRRADYLAVFRKCGSVTDFVTVNVSSPNTENLRDLQDKNALKELLKGIVAVKEEKSFTAPVFLKIAPDLGPTDLDDIVEAAETAGIDGIIATNTTLDRDGLRSSQKDEPGGLSGAPLFEKSTRVLAELSQRTELPLIGVGGVTSAVAAYEKIKAGASAVQLYSAMVYDGISLVERIATGIDSLLLREGYNSVAEAVGQGRRDFL